jgi:hypothetical protein
MLATRHTLAAARSVSFLPTSQKFRGVAGHVPSLPFIREHTSRCRGQDVCSTRSDEHLDILANIDIMGATVGV